ncbi:MAG: flagellar FlbD family protein [Acidobacteriota bacterium]
MIPVTRLDGTELLVNAELVERIEQTPDTLITLINGESLIVREAPDELMRRIVAYKQQIHAAYRPRLVERHGVAR